jgi:dTDP-4-amino-4,6-dideoxy-D-galactose acyltransferase
MTQELETFFEARKEKLFFYSPYNFIREIDNQNHFAIIQKMFVNTQVTLTEIVVEGHKFFFASQFLAWDSDYFKKPMHKLVGVLYEKDDYGFLKKAVQKFLEGYIAANQGYYFMEIPSEDITLMQALNANGFRLVETRLTYFRGELNAFNSPQRYKVRKATEQDIHTLKNVAQNTRNIYDRLHADTSFAIDIADAYLATYVENAVKGFADVVLVPNDENYSSEAFLTANYLTDNWSTIGKNVSKMVLSAVAPSCKGWYQKLITEMTYHLREQGAEYIFMNTQSTNRAVFRVWEKLGYQLGSTNHILVFQNF